MGETWIEKVTDLSDFVFFSGEFKMFFSSCFIETSIKLIWSICHVYSSQMYSQVFRVSGYMID